MEVNWTDLHHSGEAERSSVKHCEQLQRNKIRKTLIGIAVLIVISFVMWEAGTAPHTERNHATVHAPAQAPHAPAISTN
jgi:hypothetical protein